MSNIIYGLDFGTTNSAIAIANEGKVMVLPIDPPGDLMRSVMFFPEDKSSCSMGQRAIASYLASGMRGRLISSFKSILPMVNFTRTSIYGRTYTVEDLIALFLSEVKRRADAIVENDTKSVVLGRPAVFSRDPLEERMAVDRLTKAARLAGFQRVEFQIEPIAAAINYESTLTSPETTFVADLGGGTSDFTLMRLSPSRSSTRDRRSDILASDGRTIGGDTFNSKIMWARLVVYFGSKILWRTENKNSPMPCHLMHTLCDWRMIPFLKESRNWRDILFIHRHALDREPVERLMRLINFNLGFSLFEVIDRAKCELSEVNQTTIPFHAEGIDIEEPMSRKDFEEMAQKELDAIDVCVTDLFRKAQVNIQTVDSVFLTGGSSHPPMIRRYFASKFHPSKIRTSNAFTSVVSGLAKSARLFAL